MNTLWFKADIDAEMEKLRKKGHIKIEEADYLQVGSGERAERARPSRISAKELATWTFFTPGLQPGRVLAADRGELESRRSDDCGRSRHRGVQHAARTWPSREAGAPRPVESGPGSQPARRRARRSRCGAGRGQSADNSGGGDHSRRRARRVRGIVRSRPLSAGTRPDGRRPRSCIEVAQPDRGTADHVRPPPGRGGPAPDAPQGAIRLIAGCGLAARTHQVVDLNDPFFERVIGHRHDQCGARHAGVSSMVVKLRYGTRDDGTAPKDTQEFVLHQGGDKGAYSFFMDRRLSVELEYQVVVNYKPGSPSGRRRRPPPPGSARPRATSTSIHKRGGRVSRVSSSSAGRLEQPAGIQSRVVYDDPAECPRRADGACYAESATAVVPVPAPTPDSRHFNVQTRCSMPRARTSSEVKGRASRSSSTRRRGGRFPSLIACPTRWTAAQGERASCTYPGQDGQPVAVRAL